MVGMEAAAVSTAVSATLKLVGNKLAPLVFKEYSSIVGVKEDLQNLQDLAQEINSRLEAAGDRALYMGGVPSLRKLKEAVYEVDDVVDEFQLKAEKYEADGDGGFVSKYLHKKPKSLVFQCQAAKKIKKINKMFDVLVKQRNILNSLVGNDSHMNNTAVSKQTLPFVDETEVIGRGQEMHYIISKLLEKDDQQRIKIVSIVGLGGSGKTTLAQQVFQNVETMENNNFTVKLWVHVSQEEFQLEKILKKLFDAFSNERSEGLPFMNMVKKILERLTDAQFLLVLDDVWVEDRNRWKEFMVYLMKGSLGSRILLTTRSGNVAGIVESTTIMDLPLLSKDDSWQVFQQSFGKNAVKDLGSEFQELGKEIVNKCGGIPLAIKVTAGTLRNKKRVEQWHAIKDNNLLDVDDKERQVKACLWLSYFNLPSQLKQCFAICSIFPKGRLIDKDQLIDQWIAHDMVKEEGVDNLEYVGDDYFSHLVQMYFIQVVEKAWDGRVMCKMHDLVHDFSQSLLGPEISLSVLEKATNFTKTCRYFLIMEHRRHIPPKNTFEKARAMYVAGNDDFIFGKASKKAKYLRSITVEGVHTSALTAILQTKSLRYLNISGLKHETLPEVISDIWSLQALHVTSSSLVKLPESIGKLQKLRAVNLSYSSRLKSLPDSIGNCAMISSIDLFRCHNFATLPSSIGRNKRLRVLRLGHTKLEGLPSSIRDLENLEYLDLQLCSKLVELPEGIGNLKKLVVLNLKYCVKLRGIPKGIAQLTRLETLGLFVLGEDEKNHAQISELQNINKISRELTIHGIRHCTDPDVAHKEWLKHKTNLQSLTLICASDVVVNSKNQLEGLEPPPKIKIIKIAKYPGQESMQWMLNHRGAEVTGLPRFQLLSELELSEFPKLERLEGLTELPCLEKLEFREMTALKSISGGPFRSLSVLSMRGMPSLGMVWMATEVSLADVEGGQVQIGNCLSVLTISKCPKLMVMPYFPSSLKELHLANSNVQLLGQPGLGQGSSLPSFSFSGLKELVLDDMSPTAGAASHGSGCRWELLQHFTALEFLRIRGYDGLTELPESVRSLVSLRSLLITCRTDGFMLPEWLGELCSLEKMDIQHCSLSFAPSMQPLRALKALEIRGSRWVGIPKLYCPSMQTLDINDCDNMHGFRELTSLTNLRIRNCKVRQLPGNLGEFRTIQKLGITGLYRLSSLPQSLGRLTSLQELEIGQCKALGQLPDCFEELRSLRVFVIWGLQSLTCLPQSLGRLTSLQELEIGECEALGKLPDCFEELHSLRKFNIWELWSLTCLPQSLGHLTSLQELEIEVCKALGQLPDCFEELHSLRKFKIWELHSLTCLPKSLGQLTSLQELKIGDCKALGQLPESLGELRSLSKFQIYSLPSLTSVPESMRCLTSLEELIIVDCPEIRSLSEWIKGLTNLQTLEIYGCPHLEKRCERRKGKDWRHISHIPHVRIGEDEAHY